MKENWNCQSLKWLKKTHKLSIGSVYIVHSLLKRLYIRALCERNKHFTSLQIKRLCFLISSGWFWDHGRDVCQLRPLLPPYTAGVMQEPRGHRLPAEILQSHQQVHHKSTKHPLKNTKHDLVWRLTHPRQSLPHNEKKTLKTATLQSMCHTALTQSGYNNNKQHTWK